MVDVLVVPDQIAFVCTFLVTEDQVGVALEEAEDQGWEDAAGGLCGY